MKKILFLVFVAIIFAPNITHAHNEKGNDGKTVSIKLQQIFVTVQYYYGTKYVWGGTTKSGIDCSAFVQKCFISAGITNLPRTSAAQAKIGTRIPFDSLMPGDRVYFTFKPKKGKAIRHDGHTGIYKGDGVFIHASSSRGVAESNITSPFWRNCFTKALRSEELQRVKPIFFDQADTTVAKDTVIIHR